MARQKLSEVDPWELISLIATDESDRGAILAGGEYLSLILKELIAAQVVGERAGPNSKNGSDEFLNRIGEIAPRIQIAWALGLLRPEEYRNLSRVAEMRNAVAHSPMHVTFETENIAKFCAQLEWPPFDFSPEVEGRMRFFTIVKHTFITLVERIPQVQRTSPWKPIVLTPVEQLAAEQFFGAPLEELAAQRRRRR